MLRALLESLTHEDSRPLTRGLLATLALVLGLGAAAIWWRYEAQPDGAAEAEVARLDGYEGGYRAVEIYNGLEPLGLDLPSRRLVCARARVEGAERIVAVVLPPRERRHSALGFISHPRRTRPVARLGEDIVLAPIRGYPSDYRPLAPRLIAACREGVTL
jgi:hypothetical protein